MEYKLPVDINTIYKLMPHRYPFLLIDKIIDFQPNKSIVAIKNVTINEPFFQGHFPIYPVMPGVLIIEALAQAAGMLAILSLGERKSNDIYFFVGIDNARFKKQVIPGDCLYLEAEILQVKKDIGKFKAIAKVDDQVVSYATLLCAKRTI